MSRNLYVHGHEIGFEAARGGGRTFVARVEFTNSEFLSAIRQLHCDRVLDVNDPDGIAKEFLEAAFRSALGPTPPSWATIPNATNVAIYTDSHDRRFRKIFTFDATPVVFVFAGER